MVIQCAETAPHLAEVHNGTKQVSASCCLISWKGRILLLSQSQVTDHFAQMKTRRYSLVLKKSTDSVLDTRHSQTAGEHFVSIQITCSWFWNVLCFFCWNKIIVECRRMQMHNSLMNWVGVCYNSHKQCMIFVPVCWKNKTLLPAVSAATI